MNLLPMSYFAEVVSKSTTLSSKGFQKLLKFTMERAEGFLPQDGFNDYDLILQDSPNNFQNPLKSFPIHILAFL